MMQQKNYQQRVPLIDLKKVPVSREDQLRAMKILTNENIDNSPMKL